MSAVTTPPSPSTSKAMLWTGRVLSALPAAMLLFSGAMKIALVQPVLEGFPKLGWPVDLARPIGIVEIVCALLYLVPQTAVLGAILVTGYMGGAIATHVRLHEPWFVQAGLGILVWLGLFLREPRLRNILPFR
ncbi:MAG: DoxX family protein [Phycisphaerales bacterium]